MTAPTEIRQTAMSNDKPLRVYALVEQLPPETLHKAVEFLSALNLEASKNSLVAKIDPQEEALLQIIQRRLPPDEQTRLAYLRQRNETGEITEKERTSLLAYVDRLECQDAERAEALIKLAQLRKVELKTLINEFIPNHTSLDAV